ncbi:MAG: MAPEG family protein [Brevirhabdus sp.]
MARRRAILLGISTAALWSVAVVVAALHPYFGLPDQHRFSGIVFGYLIAGTPLVIMIARVAQRRLFDDNAIGGEVFAPGSGGDIDGRVLRNTVEQLVLAMAIWPISTDMGHALSPIVLSIGFVIGRFAFWIGYHKSDAVRAFGFGASFYPTALIAAAAWVYYLRKFIL